jgi:hypothetical protein
MISTDVEVTRTHRFTVQVLVNGGQEDAAVGRPHISDYAFSQALIESIVKSRIFSAAIQERNERPDYLLAVTLFSIDKRVFGRPVKLEAGWTLRHIESGRIVWQEAIVSESAESNVQVAIEGAARKNIAHALRNLSKLNL